MKGTALLASEKCATFAYGEVGRETSFKKFPLNETKPIDTDRIACYNNKVSYFSKQGGFS